MFIFQPFDELQGSHLRFQLITPRSITDRNFGTIASILDFLMSTIFQPFDELCGSNLRLQLITPGSITDRNFGTMEAILNLFKTPYLSHSMRFKALIQNISLLHTDLLLSALSEIWWPSWIFTIFLQLKKFTIQGAQRAPLGDQRPPALHRNQKEGHVVP